MSVGWVYHPDFLEHKTGPTHPERPERLKALVGALEAAGLLAKMRPIPFGPAQVAQIARVHEPAYIELVRTACEEGVSAVGSPETRICRESYRIALLAAGGAMAACDAVMAGTVNSAFCALRPPGHHAEPDYAMGFCLFNNPAVAAEHLVHHHHLKRVAIVDFDVHHGNGTQRMFEARDDVLFVSVHEDPQFLFPGTGFENETGIGPGEGYTVNVAMPRQADDAAYRRAFAQRVLPAVRAYKPQFVILSTGFDAVREDSMSDICLEPESFTWITRDLMAVADEFCQGRVVSILEGGYELDTLGRSAVAHVKAMMGEV